ncbi:LysM peptidoglycan-binding domain-containing protein [Oceanobacillus salinisoli]|uniref:LysM peptidoglycan-binding domain-containing protein n=1 Tax=Oceanobacillus salinisoli TaxID=2678611 RepID=UPI0012E24441|nr:LysM peptidoglycan-binding domain-containing protein [Oceanobacillus salinisoli]
MENIQRYEVKLDKNTNEYTLFIYLDDQLTEFGTELGSTPKAKVNFVTSARQIINERYPYIKVSMVKIMVGGMVVTSLALGTDHSKAEAAEDTGTSEVSQDGAIFYVVESGDTLWSIAKKYNTSVDYIKRANNLSSDTLKLNQRLIIPKAFHTVGSGDYLTVLAKQYNTSADAIQVANGMASNATKIGQTLIIPVLIGNTAGSTSTQSTAQTNSTYTVTSGDTLWSIARQFNTSVDAIRSANNLKTETLSIGQALKVPNGTTQQTNQPSPEATQSYTVGSGDTLWSLSRQFNTSVDAIRSANNLKTDTLSIGQTLKVPNGTTAQQPAPSSPATSYQSYTVKSGDTLWSLASRYNITVSAIKSANNLTSDTLKLGQTLTIPTGQSGVTQTVPKTTEQQGERKTFDYTVKSGDSLSALANRFVVSVDTIRSANNLKSDLLQIGQVLKIPNGLNAPDPSTVNSVSYITHTIKSGDNIWDLSVRYGIPQNELLKVNNLSTSSRLSVGQQLKIPVHHIAVKEVISTKHGEYLDWWTEAQYVFAIGKTAKVTDFATGKSFYIKRTIGANHADSETVSTKDTDIAKSIWGGFSWTPRAVIIEVDGRKLAASMSFMPHERQYITNNGITGHFDVYFGSSTRHVDGKADASHQAQVEKAAGLR